MVVDRHIVAGVALRAAGVSVEGVAASEAGVANWVEVDVAVGAPVTHTKLALLPKPQLVAVVLVAIAEEVAGSSHLRQVVAAEQLGRPIWMPWGLHWAELVSEELVCLTWRKRHEGSS